MSDLIYLVIKVGVYRHGIRGVYTTIEGARTAAKRAASEDEDSYHEYEVHETYPNEYVQDVRIVEAYTKEA